MSSHADTRFFGHPLGLATLFFTELWERFGYYGMRALLILFMTASAENGGLGFTDTEAYGIYGLYTSMVYLMSLPGGWIADRLLGQHRAVIVGGVLISIGYLMLSAPSRAVFFAGLVVVVMGTGLLKPNISTIVGQIYDKADTRRDSGFSIFYMGINLGALIAPLICGPIGQRINWQLGFAVAGIGMALGVVTFLIGRKHLGTAGLLPGGAPATPEDAKRVRGQVRLALAAIVGIPILLTVIHATGLVTLTIEGLVNSAGLMMVLLVIVLFAWMFKSGDWTPIERKRLVAIAVLFTASALFWSAFEQAGSSLNIFADRFTNNTIAGITFPASMYQSFNAGYIILLAPVFAWLWIRLGNRQPASPVKFALGLLCVGLGFVAMVIAATKAADGTRVSPLWLTVCYFFHTAGELCLSPVGLSAMTKLAPERVAGFMMGVWFVSLSAGNYIGGRLAAFYGEMPITELFKTTAAFAIIAAILLLLVARPVTRLMGGVR